MSNFRAALAAERRLIFDGGLGTLLQARGLPPGFSPELFCLQKPEILHAIHTEYAEAGADVLTTATFGASPFKLEDGMDAFSCNRDLARIARKAADEASARLGRKVFVAGDIGPSGLFLEPMGDISPEDLITGFREQIRGLVAGGVDCIIIETQIDLAESRCLVVAARRECALPVGVTMTFENGLSLTGSTPEIFAETMLNLGVDFLGTNCSAGPEQLLSVAREIMDTVAGSGVKVLVQPNAGLPELVDGATVFRLDPAPFAEATREFARFGVACLGGCCGTTPAHIRALHAALDSLPVSGAKSPSARGGLVLTGRSSLVRMGAGAPLCIIGERINPTGKKAFSAQLQAGEYGLALEYADEQLAAGALVLDVNVGAPMVDETAMLPDVVKALIGRHTAPLSLDSSNSEAIAAALPLYPGSPLINSINGDPGRMEFLGTLCKEWGAPFILLPIKGNTLPVTSAERIARIEDLLGQAQALGIPRRLIMVDVLALTVSSEPLAGLYGLETIRWCEAQGLTTVIGLSNISFGLPARTLLNSAFLAMAAGAGLSACIANPGTARLREMLYSANVLTGRDNGAERFIASYGQWKPDASGAAGAGGAAGTAGSGGSGASAGASASGGGASAAEKSVEDAVLRGDVDAITALVERDLAQGASAFELVQEKMIPAITEVGARYERREYFLPQLIRSAETMQRGFARLKPLLEEAAGSEQARPVVILATVEGDIHDIGKNILSLMLGNHGFDVHDLGKDVPASVIVAEAKARNAALIGLSALMTTTMVRMEDTVRLAREEGVDARVMVGGAVVTQGYADSIGAHGYAADAVEAVRLAQRLLQE